MAQSDIARQLVAEQNRLAAIEGQMIVARREMIVAIVRAALWFILLLVVLGGLVVGLDWAIRDLFAL